MSSQLSERQEDEGPEVRAIVQRLAETKTPSDMNLTDFEIHDLPSPPALFVKNILPQIFAHRKKFHAIPPKKDKDGAFERKKGITYLYDLCVQHGLPKSGKRPALEKRLLVFFFKQPEIFANEVAFRTEYDANLWMRFNDIDKSEQQYAEATKDSAVRKSNFRPSLLNVFYLMRQAGGVEQVLNIDSDGAFSYNGNRYDFEAVQNELAEVNTADFVGFNTASHSNPEQQLRRRTPECLLRLLTIIFLDDQVFQRFIIEGKESPLRMDLDRGDTGGNASIWKVIHKNFVDDNFPKRSRDVALGRMDEDDSE
jgi:hypothetical protein